MWNATRNMIGRIRMYSYFCVFFNEPGSLRLCLNRSMASDNGCSKYSFMVIVVKSGKISCNIEELHSIDIYFRIGVGQMSGIFTNMGLMVW